MKVYLVGGAVRDTLLERPYNEHDYVVVGATPDELTALGYRPVGKDFPVFLHPKTGDQYALARTERKTGAGYYGFETRFSPDVTLEQDLARRDLTINAMARDESGEIVDPYGGRRDLEARVLRHVSPAFSRRPVARPARGAVCGSIRAAGISYCAGDDDTDDANRALGRNAGARARAGVG